MKCIVLDKVYIPGIGMGPILTPFDANGRGIRTLIKNVSKNFIIFPDEDIEKYKDLIQSSSKKVEEPVVEEVIEGTVEEEIVEEVIEEVIEESVAEEVIEEAVEEPVAEEIVEEVVEEPVAEEAKFYTREELEEMTVAELKKILDELGIGYLYKDTKTTLINKILAN